MRQVIEVLHEPANAVNNFDSVRITALFHDRDVDRSLTIYADDVVLNLAGVFGFAHVLHGNPRIANCLQRNFIHLAHVADKAVRIYVVIEGPDFHITGGKDEVRAVHGADDIHQAQVARHELVRVYVNHDLPILAAEWRRYFGAFDNRDLVSNRKLRVIVKLGLAESLAFDGDETDRLAGSIEFEDDRRQGARRQALQIR